MTVLLDKPAPVDGPGRPMPHRRAEPAAPAVAGRHAGGFRAAASILALLSLVSLGFVTHLLLFSGIQQAREQEVVMKNFRYDLSQAVAPVGPTDLEGAPVPMGAPIAVLSIPALDMEQVVVEGTRSGDLMTGPGHRRDTVYPGQPGTSVIVGRRVAYGGPFAALDRLAPGDIVTVLTGQGEVTYEVERLRRDTDLLPPPLEPGAARMVLVTADDPLWPTEPIYVDARQTSIPQQLVAGRAPALAPQERVLQGDPTAVLALALWCQALVATALALTWAWIRWGRWEAYLVGIPVVLAVTWNVYESAVRLLPNVL